MTTLTVSSCDGDREGGREREREHAPLIMALAPTWGTTYLTSSEHNCLPIALSPNTNTLKFWENTNIRVMTPSHTHIKSNPSTILCLHELICSTPSLLPFLLLKSSSSPTSIIMIKSNLFSSLVMFHENLFPRLKAL